MPARNAIISMFLWLLSYPYPGSCSGPYAPTTSLNFDSHNDFKEVSKENTFHTNHNLRHENTKLQETLQCHRSYLMLLGITRSLSATVLHTIVLNVTFIEYWTRLTLPWQQATSKSGLMKKKELHSRWHFGGKKSRNGSRSELGHNLTKGQHFVDIERA